MNSAQRWTSVLVLGASLAAMGMHFFTATNQNIAHGDKTLPDYYVNSPEWKLFNSEGELARQLSAIRLEQWPDQEPVLIEPRLRLRDRQQNHWLASARRGLVSAADRWLALEQGVRLSREPATEGPVVTTEYLRIADNGEKIETDRAVAIDSGSWHVNATGLRAELGRQRMQLLGEVRGIHD